MRTGRPNILLVTTDTSRTDTLGCYGSTHAISPHLDALAAQGVVFEQAHTNAPVCMPARTSLLTGTHTPIHGTVENALHRRRHLTPCTDLLADVGYRTIMVGKTHFGPMPDSFAIQHPFAGEKGGPVQDEYADFLADHGYQRSVAEPGLLPEELTSDAWAVDTAIAEIDKVGATPFFLHCSLLSPHSPLDPPQRWIDAFADRELPPVIPGPDEPDELPRQLRDLLGLDDADTPDPDEIDRLRRLYYASAAATDAQIGRLVDHLDHAGLAENTLVIVTSDHGQQYYDHGFNDKHTFYDASWRIPLILRQPGTIPGGARQGFAMLTDVTATILAAAGVDFPPVQGFDLLPAVRDGRASPRRCATAVLYRSLALCNRRWKLEYYPDEDTGRLFDRIADPDELTDLYRDPTCQGVRDELLTALLIWRADLCDVEALQVSAGRGGPVAKRAMAMSAAVRGVDAEARVSARAAVIDDGAELA
ncbi:sulfatase family protein [Ruania alba]|uniref:Arylsulfatase A n=1 Tax=Ruania alba TaxID=648782 RepID=A0A1H5B5I5_9MICO|nr:sulfatase-like hydrolase/transferase [Ruania alba]SED49812.1 Arylsulfatase A [Ruania alba]